MTKLLNCHKSFQVTKSTYYEWFGLSFLYSNIPSIRNRVIATPVMPVKNKKLTVPTPFSKRTAAKR